MNILISNLNSMTTAIHLSNLFMKFGSIQSVKIIRDNINGHSSGVGYIEMNMPSGAVAIHELNNIKFMNFYIEVAEMPV